MIRAAYSNKQIMLKAFECVYWSRDNMKFQKSYKPKMKIQCH